jgi:hypothetical protein
MKQIYVLIVLLVGVNAGSYSQQFIEKEKQVEVLETTELETRKISIGLGGGIVQYLGEYTSEMGLDYGLLIRNHINSKFDITYNFHLGDALYKDSADISQKTSYFGANALFKLNLIEIFTKSEKPKLISPYIGAGFGALISKATHYTINQYADFYFPVAAGVDINVSENFIVGVNATARILFSDEWDNNQSSGGNDVLFNPSLSLKYLIRKRKTSKQEYVTKIIKYKEAIVENESLGKYEQKEIESFVEISVREIRDSSVVTSQVDAVVTEGIMKDNTLVTNINIKETGESTVVTKKQEIETAVSETLEKEVEVEKETASNFNSSDQNYIFYTVQVGTFNTNDYEVKKITQDFEFFNKELGKYNYCKGFFNTYGNAKEELNEIKDKGVNGFVIAIYKDKRLKGYTAKKLIDSGEVRANADAAKSIYLK